MGEIGGETFKEWFGLLITKKEEILKKVARVVEWVKSKGYTRIGIMGFCWGGGLVVGIIFFFFFQFFIRFFFLKK